jgi:hypothetical protein
MLLSSVTLFEEHPENRNVKNTSHIQQEASTRPFAFISKVSANVTVIWRIQMIFLIRDFL